MRIGNEYCDNKEIFYIEDRDGYYWINGSEGYPKKGLAIIRCCAALQIRGRKNRKIYKRLEHMVRINKSPGHRLQQ